VIHTSVGKARKRVRFNKHIFQVSLQVLSERQYGQPFREYISKLKVKSNWLYNNQ